MVKTVRKGQERLSAPDRNEQHHHHGSSSARDMWLEVVESAASTMTKYEYCPVCGAIREKADPGRRNEFFFNAFSKLKKSLSSDSKITESQARLIVKRIGDDDNLCDTFSASFESQVSRYVDIVRSIRPDLEPDRIIKSAHLTR